MNNNQIYCENIRIILHRMGYRKFKELGYIKPVAFTVFIFRLHPDNNYSLEQYILNKEGKPVVWKSSCVLKEELETMDLPGFQILESYTGRELNVLGYFDESSEQLVPELTTEELLSLINELL